VGGVVPRMLQVRDEAWREDETRALDTQIHSIGDVDGVRESVYRVSATMAHSAFRRTIRAGMGPGEPLEG
jgi:hypothetical protein